MTYYAFNKRHLLSKVFLAKELQNQKEHVLIIILFITKFLLAEKVNIFSLFQSRVVSKLVKVVVMFKRNHLNHKRSQCLREPVEPLKQSDRVTVTSNQSTPFPWDGSDSRMIRSVSIQQSYSGDVVRRQQGRGICFAECIQPC